MVVMVVILLWIKIFADATLCVIASLKHYQCFLRKDVFPIFVLGSISRNAVPRAVFPNTLPREQVVYSKM